MAPRRAAARCKNIHTSRVWDSGSAPQWSPYARRAATVSRRPTRHNSAKLPALWLASRAAFVFFNRLSAPDAPARAKLSGNATRRRAVSRQIGHILARRKRKPVRAGSADGWTGRLSSPGGAGGGARSPGGGRGGPLGAGDPSRISGGAVRGSSRPARRSGLRGPRHGVPVTSGGLQPWPGPRGMPPAAPACNRRRRR